MFLIIIIIFCILKSLLWITTKLLVAAAGPILTHINSIRKTKDLSHLKWSQIVEHVHNVQCASFVDFINFIQSLIMSQSVHVNLYLIKWSINSTKWYFCFRLDYSMFNHIRDWRLKIEDIYSRRRTYVFIGTKYVPFIRRNAYGFQTGPRYIYNIIQ